MPSWLHLSTDSLEQTVLHAKKLLTNVRREKGPNAKLAMVMDLDDTVMLDNGPEKRQRVIPLMRELYNYAKSPGLQYAVFFITARPDREGNYSATRKQLDSMGFRNYDGLFLMPPQFREKSRFCEFKFLVREKLRQDGWCIVLNAGDSYHDVMVLPDVASNSRHAESMLKRLQREGPDKCVLFSPLEPCMVSLKMPSRE